VLPAASRVSRAADALGLSQPAASQGLTRLRLALGAALFVRASGRMRPTLRAERLASLLFPMEKLFEKYVAAWLRVRVKAGTQIRTPAASESLCSHADNDMLRLEPDVLISTGAQRWGAGHEVKADRLGRRAEQVQARPRRLLPNVRLPTATSTCRGEAPWR
jgi:DNA-binding transcriptional LysR family regulator